MVSDFLDRLGREFAQESVARLGQPLQQQMLPGREQQLPGNRPAEVAVRLLDQQAIAEIEHVAVEGEPVGIVISRGRDVEPAPVFSAYMYAPVPDDALVALPVLAGA